MDTPLVSICCLVYNHEPFLRECFEGFVMQKTTFPIEVLVHDDASTDHSADIIREYTEKYPDIFKPIYQTENQYSKGKGFVGLQLNFERAQGKYIAMCEGDDYWTDPLKLQKQVDFLEENEDFVLCFHDRDIKKNDTIYKETVKPQDDVWQINEAMHYYIPTQTILFKNLKNIIPRCCQPLDVVIFISLSRYGKIKYLDFNGAVYHIHEGGLWNGSSNLTNYTRTVKALRNCWWCMSNVDKKGLAAVLTKWIFKRFQIYVNSKSYVKAFFDFMSISFYSVLTGDLDDMRRCKWYLK